MKIIFGITGSIAAYKALDLIRLRKKQGDDVKIIMTRSAQEFATPLSCQTLSGHEVYTDQFVLTEGIKHIALSSWADLLVIAPATANILGKAASGIADDLLSTTIISFPKPILFVPAMDTGMWENCIVQKNVKQLREVGYYILEPGCGALASGRIGRGRFPDVQLIDRAIDVTKRGLSSLRGHNVLISGGRTEEDIDPVRTVTNRSSGTMALELMYAVIARGGNARCVMGQTSISMPPGIDIIPVRTSDQMFKNLKEHISWCDCLIMAAAVGDYKPRSRSKHKVHAENLALRMNKNKDILKSLQRYKTGKFFIGFSLEDRNAVIRGRKKLKEKGLDLIVLNGTAGIGACKIQARLLGATRTIRSLGTLTKQECAHHILDVYMKQVSSKTVRKDHGR